MQPREPRFEADYSRGFLTCDLFALSRHPNFFAEQVIWVSFALFAVFVAKSVCIVAVAGVIGLILLFQGSTNFTEEITGNKYPEYAQYKRTTSRLWPWFPRTHTD